VSKHKSGSQRVAIICLYCDYRDQENQNATNMMGSLVKQLVMGLPEIPDKIREAFKRSMEKEKRLELEGASEMLLLALQSFDRAYICVDALDECEREHRRSLLKSLGQLLQTQNPARACLFLTGRPQIIESDVNECLAIKSPDPVLVEASKNDIVKYLSYRINKDHDPKAMNEDLREEIVTTIANGSGGMYVSRNDHHDSRNRD
jgi:NACHT domain